jgi:hypothetical protein
LDENTPNGNDFNYYLKPLFSTFSDNFKIRIYTKLALQEENEITVYFET